MILDRPRKMYDSYMMKGVMEGVSGNFSASPNGIKVNTRTFYTVFEPYKNSWETMVTLGAPRDSAAKETSFLTSSRFL